MGKIKLLAVLAVFGMLFMGCAAARQPVTGFWFSDVKGPEAVAGGAATKTGEACATSILGLIATGDASIETAKKAGGITEVSHVDHHSTSILGLFAKYCTEVRGR